MAKTSPRESSIRHAALKRMLRPLVRFWIKNFDTIQSFVDILKLVFVEVAVDELQKSKSKINVSKLSVMTGIHRIDVTKIYRQEDDYGHNVPDVVTRLIGKWQKHARFTTKEGKPRVLTYGNDASDFSKLVRSISKAVSPGSVLFELERSGAVKKTKNGLSLSRPSFRITKDFEKVSELMAKDVETLMLAVQENVDAAAEVSPNHHIRTEYDNIYVRDVPHIRSWLRKEGKRFHKRVRDYISAFDKDIVDKSGEAGAKVSMTGFSLISEPPLVEGEGDDD